MPAFLFTRTFQIIAGVLTIPVVGFSIIGSSYTSPFLDHLADIVNGNSTLTVDSMNAPNWSFGAPLAQVVGLAAATSTDSGTLASSTPFSFMVAALDGTGTTTLSSAVTQSTDASTSANEEIQVSWSAVPGAMGYAIFEATGTVTTATGFSQYFYATSSNGIPNTSYTFATSTGSLAGTYTKSDPTAYSIKLNPLGTSFLDGGSLGLGTTTPQATIDVASGTLRAYSISTSTCAANNDGAIFYNAKDKHLYVCEAATWQIIK
jgi:hypothetical protein